MDIKTPGSGMVDENYFGNIIFLDAHDEIKFVLTDKEDYRWAKEILKNYKLKGKFIVHFSPAYKVFEPRELAELILKDKLNVRLHIQLHKYINLP